MVLHLWSAVQQYGVLLIPIEDFQKDKSLCPRKYYGTKIDVLRYRDMSTALYQLLNSIDTIPSDHTDVRNIIIRHASQADGYNALYEIMERINPLLNPDAKLQAPQSINSTDIHDYYNQVDSYFLHNSLEEIFFTTRRQINIFIEGLDPSYTPAIQELRRQMRTWKKHDPEPPDDLKLQSIASTVERIMQEDVCTPIIRTTIRPQPSSRLKSRTTKPSVTDNTRPYIDIQCSYCKMYGHKKASCDKMSLWLTLRDTSQHIDDKTKTRLIETYTKHNMDKRTKRLQRLKGTVRQLYSEGALDQADELWDQLVPSHHTDDESDHENTSTSSQE